MFAVNANKNSVRIMLPDYVLSDASRWKLNQIKPFDFELLFKVTRIQSRDR